MVGKQDCSPYSSIWSSEILFTSSYPRGLVEMKETDYIVDKLLRHFRDKPVCF